MSTDNRSHPTIQVFGGIGVSDADTPVSIGGPRQRRVLALLTAKAGSVVSMDWLAEYVWTDDDRPGATAPAIRTYISRLRQALPEAAQEWIETLPAGYRLDAPTKAIEHRRFTSLRAEATRARDRDDPQAAQNLLDEALGLWRGDPFVELEDLDWARAEIEQLNVDRLEMMEERWETALALGRHTQITGELAAFTAEHGLRERAARQLALALHRSGRTAEGLRVIDEHRRVLADESGLDPSPAIVELENSLLAGDPALDVEKVGRPLRGYRLLEEMGAGAFSIVWRGIQPSVDREVAIKQIRAELASQPEFIRRFEAEAHLVARIEHPHIVPLIDYWRDPDSAYLVMRWMRGGTLERLLDDGPLTVEQTLKLAHQIGGALSAAHSHGVVHRDVKTANILCDEHGNSFLSDFGIALTIAESGGPEAALSPGSPAYSSPEQIRRERLGPQADIFSLGVVIFECLTGSLPFPQSSSVPELVEHQLTTPYPLLDELRADVPSALAAAVARATAKDPSERFATIDEFVDALELLPATGAGAAPEPARPVLAGPITNPYKGLRAFDDGDSHEFFGRESLVNEVVARLAGDTVSSRCVVLVGPSGSGKSSVVRAGLTPALRAGAVTGSSDWFTTTLVPGADPFESLEAALLRIAVNPPPTLLRQLRDSPRGILRSVRRCLGSDRDRVLIAIDQFEELFIGASADDAHRFLEALSVAVDDPSSPLRLVITLRADYYDRPLEHPTFANIVKRSVVEVTPLAGDELERAIVEPARHLGVEFEPGLVARIAAETVGQPSPLPLLQYALSELFDRRSDRLLSVAAYDDVGGLTGALAASAEAIYDQADAAQRAAIRRTFGRMTNPGGATADLRRRVAISDLGDDEATAAVLERFGAARLVTFDRDVATREPTVEVAHEALLREWPRLAEWLAEDRDILRQADAVSSAATTWEQGGRAETDLYRGGRLENATGLALAAPDRLRPLDSEFVEASRAAQDAERATERRRVTRLRRLVAGTAVALVIALIAGAFAFRQQRRADDEADAARVAAAEAENQAEIARSQTDAAEAATAQADLATLISRSAALTTDDPEVSVLLALEANRRAPGPETEQAILNALGSSSVPNRLSTLGPIVDPSSSCKLSFPHHDGTNEFAIRDGVMISRDTLTGAVVEHGAPPEPCVFWGGDVEANLRFALSEDQRRFWYGPLDGDWELEMEFDEQHWFVWDSFVIPDRLIFWVLNPSILVQEVSVYDERTGEAVVTGVNGGDEAQFATASGSLLAASFATFGREGGDGKTIVVDVTTGEEVVSFLTDQPAARLTFDAGEQQLIAGVFPNEIVTFDLQTQEIIASVKTTSTSEISAVGIRPDGLIVVASAAQVDIIDRLNGPIGDAVELRDVGYTRVRPDGNIFAVNGAGDRSGVIAIGGNALVERTLATDPFVRVGFNGGRAATIVRRTGTTAEVIDLASGERVVTELQTPDGDPFIPAGVYPEADGLWAVGFGNEFARWSGDELVEWIDVGGELLSGGTRFGDLHAHIGSQPDGTKVAILFDFGRDDPGVLYTVPAPDGVEVHPTLDGGMYMITADGTLLTYDSTGELVGELEVGVDPVGLLAMEPTTGLLAVVGQQGIFIVDPATGDVSKTPDVAAISSIGFARGGELLAITAADGTNRLWDVERNVSAGVVWDGSGETAGSPPWYDPATDSIWLVTSGQLLQVPLDPIAWIARACEIAGRDFTQDEWDQFVPGGDEVLSACAENST